MKNCCNRTYGKCGEIKNLAIVQARCASTRLPNKVILKLNGKTVLERVIQRVSRAKKVNEVIVATTLNTEDVKIVRMCSVMGVRVYTGAENDVLDRFYQIAKIIKPENIIRITSDCPLVDGDLIDKVIDEHIKNNADYTANAHIPTYPDGLDAEAIKYQALEDAWKKSRLLSEREHVTLYIKKRPKKYKIINVASPIDYSGKRWTLDNKEDYIFIRKIYRALGKGESYFSMDDIINYLRQHPEVEKINQNIIRNEGLQKSLKNDKKIN